MNWNTSHETKKPGKIREISFLAYLGRAWEQVKKYWGQQGEKLNWNPGAKVSLIAAICLLLPAMGLIALFSITEADNSNEATRPVAYWFEKDTRSFNNIDSTSKMIVDLDEPVGDDEVRSEDDIEVPLSFLEDLVDGKDIVDEVNVISGEEKLEIRFQNLEYLTHSLEGELGEQEEFLEHNVVFPEGSITSEQNEEYKLPFKLHEVTPGFKDTFLETDYSDINDYVFDKAPPRDISVVMPSLYIESVQTLHGSDGDGQYLSNLDIEAHEDVQNMRVYFGTGDDYIELSRREDVDFTAGRAKLGKDIYDDEIKLEAYDEKGKLLEKRVVRLKIDEEEDYTADEPGVFDDTATLYDLMENPDLLEEAVTHIPVSQLNVLGLVYNFHEDKGLYLGEVDVIQDEVEIEQGEALEIDLEGAEDQFGNTFEGSGRIKFDVDELEDIDTSEIVEVNFDADGKADDVEVLSSGDTEIQAQENVRIDLTTELEKIDAVDSFDTSIEAVANTFEVDLEEQPSDDEYKADVNIQVVDKNGDEYTEERFEGVEITLTEEENSSVTNVGPGEDDDLENSHKGKANTNENGELGLTVEINEPDEAGKIEIEVKADHEDLEENKTTIEFTKTTD